jgi:predicted acetyltransferase
MAGDLRLRPARLEDEATVRIAQRELAADDFEFAFGLTDDASWVELLGRWEHQRLLRPLPPGYVPGTFLLAVVDGEVVGRSSIRYELNEWLAQFAGHIGYGIRPAHRRRGYATEILRQSLVIVRAMGVDEVLVTCDDDNAGSAGAIERCGGELERVALREDGTPFRRYWIR